MHIKPQPSNNQDWIPLAALLYAMLLSSIHPATNFYIPAVFRLPVTLAFGLILALLAWRLQRKQTRAEQRYAQIEALTNSMNGGIVTYALDSKLSILYANDGYYQLIGYTRQEVRDQFNNSGLHFMGADELLSRRLEQSGVKADEENMSIEFQLHRKDGRLIWIRANCQRTRNPKSCDTLSYLMVDVTESKRSEQALLLEKERYLIATELTNDIIFEYDIKSDTLDHAAKYEKIFGRAPRIKNFNRQLEHIDWISENTRPALEKLGKQLAAGQATMSAELKLLDVNRNYTWCHIRGKTLYDDTGAPRKVIGKIVNVDAQKKALEILYEKSRRDPLTGLYNKTVSRTLIDNTLQAKQENASHALMIIDVDNFKAVNDNLGHLAGDDALIGIAAQLQALFRSNDIVGRIGGDEFVVFMRDVSSVSDVLQKAASVSRLARGSSKEPGISCSIGIALSPRDGVSYTDLLRQADAALYRIKKNGKNSFALAETPKQAF